MGNFWQRLTATQKISLVSLVVFLFALPVGLYLSQQTQIFNPRASVVISGPIPGLPQPPTCSLGGLSSLGNNRYSFVASARGTGRNLKLIEVYQRNASDSGELREHFTKVGAANCNSDTCTLSTSHTFSEPGDYVVVCNAHYTSEFNGSAADSCSGNLPGIRLDPDEWSYCGSNSTLGITVPKAGVTEQSFPINWGYNFVGVNFSTGSNYTAEDFLQDLNNSFIPGFQASNTIQGGGGAPPSNDKVSHIFHYDAANRVWEVHALGNTKDDNFQIVTGVGYLIRAYDSG
ncbi:hypothetical protein CMO96_01990, partial [Candidatus Woesebacteria bacterium]|nr:hypothetical protein [Candidatus Woesebacteria bacterium]